MFERFEVGAHRVEQVGGVFQPRIERLQVVAGDADEADFRQMILPVADRQKHAERCQRADHAGQHNDDVPATRVRRSLRRRAGLGSPPRGTVGLLCIWSAWVSIKPVRALGMDFCPRPVNKALNKGAGSEHRRDRAASVHRCDATACRCATQGNG